MTQSIETRRGFPSQQVEDIYVEDRLNQLTQVVAPKNGKSFKWKENKAVRKPFFSGTTFVVEEVDVTASPEELARIRAYSGFAIYTELDGLGRSDKAQDTITQAKVNVVFSA